LRKTLRMMRRLGAVLLAAILLAGSPAAAQAAAVPPLPTPTLHSATIDRTPEGAVKAIVANITLKFTAPLPPDAWAPDYVVWADDKVVAMTSFPHDVDPQNPVMTVSICQDPGGTPHSCHLWVGNPPQRIPMTGNETFRISQQPFQGGTGYGPSSRSNGLVPTEVD
jgi:hypothetical protein